MFLRSITLKGFKSFADRTTLDLEPGVTVVVGPNGSGKSNVVDAIAWVLGAQAPSAVRSQKMEDVIFAGTQSRPALGRAEVSLTIDNSARMLPIDFEEVTLTRTLFRSGDSEYAINRVPCRLLDVQELLSDTGVGRQQHVIVSQGQIDAVLNARPEERRAIVEEAAGVLKFRRRKEKAERRLAATEANLTRLNDLVREVRRQLRPLERQAEAARRHGALVDELTALRVHLAGREVASLRTRLDENRAAHGELSRSDSELTSRLAELDAGVLAAEAQLAATGGHDTSDSLVKYEALRERSRGTANLLAERIRGLERERESNVDADVLAALESEAAGLARELESVEEATANLRPDTERLRQAERELADDRARFEEEWGEGIPSPSGAAAEVRGELGALVQAVERAEAARSRLGERADELDAELDAVQARKQAADQRLHEARSNEPSLAEAAAEAERSTREAQAALEQVEVVLVEAERDRGAWTARADALALALDEARARSGAEDLDGLDGVVGTLLELVDIDPGWEAAFEAAAGDAVAAVVVADPAVARRAVEMLRGGDASGAVLALGAAPLGPIGPTIGARLRAHVRSSVDGVELLLDSLIGSACAFDSWPEALDAALANPTALIVTREGDRFGSTGWRVGVPRAGATGAALEEAIRRAEEAIAAVDAAQLDVDRQRAALEEASRARDEAADRLADARSAIEAATTEVATAERGRRELVVEIEGVRRHLDELGDRLERDQARSAELDALLPALEADDAEVVERGRQLSLFRSRLEQRAGTLAALRTDLEVKSAGIDERRQLLASRLGEVDERLARHSEARDGIEARRVDVERKLDVTRRLAALVESRMAVIDRELGALREARRRQSDEAREVAQRLDRLRAERSTRETELRKGRDDLQRVEVERAEVELRLETAVEALRRDFDCDPARAMATDCPELADGVTPAGRARELERELRLMGPINPLALEEYDGLRERHDFLQQQLDDVKRTRRELGKVIRAVDEEIVNVFAAAYADVADNFQKLFGTLFPGGAGKLMLTRPDNLLETGIEIEAKPSGKNVKKLSLLSGGERSLTALAFLFAVFRSRPSPFYVMDEVEAALDDVNLHRFLGLVHEFQAEAQLIIVSHQKRTMEAADCLYGVTMKPGGSSALVGERVGADA